LTIASLAIVGWQARIVGHKSAERDLGRLGTADRRAVVAALEAFAADASADFKKLVGAEKPRWRLRVGRFRAIMSLEPGG